MQTEIPTFESVSPEYARLTKRRDELVARLHEIDRESASIHTEATTLQLTNPQRDRISALINSADYEPPAPTRERLGALAAERYDINEALHQLAIQVNAEHQAASRTITALFNEEYRALAADFFKHLAAAAQAHNAFGAIHLKLHRAGVEPLGQWDFGRELFGNPLDRNNDVGFALRDVVKHGHVSAAELPEVFR